MIVMGMGILAKNKKASTKTSICTRLLRHSLFCFVGKVAHLPMTLKDGTWHHICITWITRDGIWSVYQDGVERGASDNLASWHSIKPHGVMILGQEQVCLISPHDLEN